jgi:hypothetical protein
MWTDMTKITVTLRSIANALKKWKMWSRGFRKYSSAIARGSLTRSGYNAVGVTRTVAYACWLFLATNVKNLRPISSISWIIFIMRVSEALSLTLMQATAFYQKRLQYEICMCVTSGCQV